MRIPQVQELLGSDLPTTIRLFKGYVDSGFDATAGVFAEIAKLDPTQYSADNPLNGMVTDTLGVTFTADKAGGIATPNLAVSTLTRALGPLAGQASNAIMDSFNPNDFFPPGGLAPAPVRLI